jgi:hypothetical protein
VQLLARPLVTTPTKRVLPLGPSSPNTAHASKTNSFQEVITVAVKKQARRVGIDLENDGVGLRVGGISGASKAVRFWPEVGVSCSSPLRGALPL